MEAYVHSTEINSIDFVIPESQHVLEIIEQNSMMFKRSAAALNAVLGKTDYFIEDRFSVSDIIVRYTISWGQELGQLSEFPNLLVNLERLFEREHCTLTRH